MLPHSSLSLLILLCHFRISLLKLLGKSLYALPALRSVVVPVHLLGGGHLVRLAGDGHGWAHGDTVPSSSFFAIREKEEEVPAIKPVEPGDGFKTKLLP